MDELSLFSRGFFAFQQSRYLATINCLEWLLDKFPETSMRDMALFWLAQACFKVGNLEEAARLMAQFSLEYPDSSDMMYEVDEELMKLAARYVAE